MVLRKRVLTDKVDPKNSKRREKNMILPLLMFKNWRKKLTGRIVKSVNMETDSYKDGETDTWGYAICCDIHGFFGGLSGWWIFFIIVIVIGCLSAAGAAFWFFYWKRKMGGRDGENSEDTDSMESSTKGNKSDIEISVDTY